MEMTAHMRNVEVASFQNQFLVNYAISIDATFVVRGIRNVSDFVFEFGMQNVNADLGPSVTTVFLAPPRHLAEVSSSLVKGLVGPDGWERVASGYVPPVVLRQLIGLKHQVWEHLQILGAVGDKYEFWSNILFAYMKPGRHYHDWRHIVEMLNLFNDDVRKLASSMAAVEVGILFHDRVYNPFRSDNEAASCDVMRQMCKHVGLSKMFGDEVEGLIMATRHNEKFPPQTSDEKLLIDLDLAILGADPIRFDEYEAGIRAEYEHISVEDFAKGRSQVLQGILDRERIYYTDYFQEKYGVSAVENLKRSIAKLSIDS